MRRIPLLAALTLLLLGVGSAALAQTSDIISEAVSGLTSDPIYVHPDAEAPLTDAEAEALRDRIKQENAGPVYIAILPEAALNAAGGDPVEVLRQIRAGLNREGVYAGVIGRTFRAAPTLQSGYSGNAVGELAGFASANASGSVNTLLSTFVGGLSEARAGESVGTGARSRGVGGFSLLPFLLIGGAALFAVRSIGRKRTQRTQQTQQLAQVREVAEEDLTTLGNDIYELDKEFTMPDANPGARAHYDQAVTAYQQARNAMDTARTPDQLAAATEAMEKGQYAVACSRAVLAGQPVPEHRAPCFFAPSHGPSTREVEWAPPGGDPRPVPACEADAQRVERGEEPQTRHITVDGYSRPYYDAPAHYGGYYGGYYGGFGGLGFLQGMMLGQLFGGFGGFGGLGGFGGFGGGWGGGGYGGGDFGGGGGFGSFGGGDFGGGGGFGDFGGGDF